MKKFLLAVVLAFATAAFAQSGGEAQATAPAQQKTIKDPNEYNAYISATSQTDPAQKAAALEAFVQQYPTSIVKEEALVGAMSAYQAAGNAAKVMEAATKVLQAYPTNISAIAVSVYGKRSSVNSGRVPAPQAQQMLGEAAQLARQGLTLLSTWPKPEGVADADFQKQKIGITAIFNGAIGQDAAGRQDWENAQKYLKEAVTSNPSDFFDVYFAGVAYLTPKQNTDDKVLTGIWYAARAASLAPQAPDVAKFGKFYYKKYHGHEEGWDQFVAQVKSQTAPPSNLATLIKKAPSPAEQVSAMLAQNPNIETLTFGEWVLVFTYGGTQDKDAAFQRIMGKPFKFQGQVISATEDTVNVALTQDAIDAKQAEVAVSLTEPLKKAPAAGSTFSFQGNPVAYTSTPFLITMDKGVDLTPAAKSTKKPTKAPAKKKPAAKKRR